MVSDQIDILRRQGLHEVFGSIAAGRFMKKSIK